MNRYITTFYLFLGALLLFIGCEDRSTSTNQETTDNEVVINRPNVLNGSLSFDTRGDFNLFVQELRGIPQDELNEYMENEFGEFTSLRQRKEKLQKQNGTSTQSNEILQLDVKDPNFESIINEQGVFQIEDQVFKITNKHTYLFKDREAFDSFTIPKNKLNDPTTSYIAPCEDRQIEQLEEEVYRIENCGGTGGGGGTDPGDGDDGGTNPDDLDPSDNIDIDYASSRTSEYESGGTTGRLRGESWNQNFFIYSSVGTKSVHERHTWGKWWDRTAEEITLDSFIKYSYGEKKVGFSVIEAGLNYNYGSFAAPIVNSILTDVLNMSSNSTLTRFITDQVSGLDLELTIYKHELNEGYDVDLSPEFQEAYTKKKLDAKRIKKTYDWSTAIVSYPPGIEESAVDFKLEILRSVHTLKHDGYHLGFITDKRE